MTQIVMDDRQPHRSGLGVHLAMTAVSLAIVGGFVLWLAWPSSRPQTESAAGDAAASSSAEETMPRGGLAELYGEQEAAARTITEWLYIVETEAQTKDFFALLELVVAEDNPARAASRGTVVWFESEESEVNFWRVTGESDAVRDHLGLPRLKVVDLRSAARTTGPNVQVGEQR